MVDYVAEVYNQEDNSIIGIRVKIASEVGDVIETINVTNHTDFEEIIAQLETIDETYIQRNQLESILTNIGGTTEINATKLDGVSAGGYAPANHSHSAEDISNLYQYEISVSNYNPSIGDNILVTGKVTDYQDRNIANKIITIKKDNANWASNVTTNSKGEFTKSYTCTEPGVVTFSLKNAKAQCNIPEEWQQLPLLKEMPFECELWVLKSQRLANLVMYIPRYVGWCKSTSTSGMTADNIDQNSIRFIGENGVTDASKGYTDTVKASKRTYKFNGTNTLYVLPAEYSPKRTISQPLYRGDFIAYLERDGSISGMAKTYSTGTNNVNYSVDVALDLVWRY